MSAPLVSVWASITISESFTLLLLAQVLPFCLLSAPVVQAQMERAQGVQQATVPACLVLTPCGVPTIAL